MALLKVEDNFQATIVGNYSTSASTITLSAVPALVTAGYLTVFDFDGNQFEKIKFGGVSGNDITSVLRGLSFTTNSDTEITGNKKELKNGMTVKLSVSQNYHNDVVDRLNGTTPVDGVMKNPASRTISDARHLVDKEYADAISSSGINSMLVTDNGGITVNINSGYYILNGSVEFYAGVAAEELTDDATNYIEIVDGVLSINTTAFSDDAIPLAIVVCSGEDITSLTDARPFYTGVDVKADSGLSRDANGIFIDLGTNPGLEITDGKLAVKIKENGGILMDENGLSVPLGYEITSSSANLSNGSRTCNINLTAPSGKVCIGGGMTSSLNDDVVSVTSNGPTSSTNWNVKAYLGGSGYTATITAYAIWAKLS